jgi:hypothetical protein
MYAKKAFCGCRAKYSRPTGYTFTNFHKNDMEEMTDNNNILTDHAHQAAEEKAAAIFQQEQEIITHRKMKEEEEAFKKYKQKLEEEKKKQSEEEEKKKHEPQPMDLENIPKDHLLKPPIIGAKNEEKIIVQKEAPLGSKKTYYTQIV